VHNARKHGKAWLTALVGAVVARSPPKPGVSQFKTEVLCLCAHLLYMNANKVRLTVGGRAMTNPKEDAPWVGHAFLKSLPSHSRPFAIAIILALALFGDGIAFKKGNAVHPNRSCMTRTFNGWERHVS
jgi:hypothetical protein